MKLSKKRLASIVLLIALQSCFVNKNPLTNTTNSSLAKYQAPTSKGDVDILISIPYINSFNYKISTNRRSQDLGFLGIGTGIKYRYSKYNSLHVEALLATDFLLPFPAPVDYFGETISTFTTATIFVENKHHVNKFNLGYGIHGAVDEWRLFFEESPTNRRKLDSSISRNLGLNASAYYKITSSFSAGIRYRPSIYSITESTFEYNEFLSVGLQWDIGL